MLAFIVPVRHPQNSKDWNRVKRNLSEAVRSIAAQDGDNWRAVIVANHEADLPELPPRVEALRVRFPPNPLYERGSIDHDAWYAAVRLDKGRRILAGMRHASDASHFMFADDDDLVSRRLSGFVARNADAPGWFCQEGYVWPSGGRLAYLHPRFSRFCGTSHIVRSDLFQLAPGRQIPDEYIKRILGSHNFIEDHFRAAGTALAPLPFPGAVYRVAQPESHSGTPGLLRTFYLRKDVMGSPTGLLRAVFRLRPLTEQLRGEFSIPTGDRAGYESGRA